MLDFPDLFDTLDKTIRSQIDFDKCDSMDLDKIKNVDFEKLNRQEVSKILKKYIKSYTDNGNYEEKRNEIKKYASEYLDKEYPISLKTAMNIHMGMNKLQLRNIFIKIPLQAFVLYVELMKCAYTYIHEKYIQIYQLATWTMANLTILSPSLKPFWKTCVIVFSSAFSSSVCITAL